MTVASANRTVYIHAIIGIIASAVLTGFIAVAEISTGHPNWIFVISVFVCVVLINGTHAGIAFETQQVAAMPDSNPNKVQDEALLAKVSEGIDVLGVISKSFLPSGVTSTLATLNGPSPVTIHISGSSAITATTPTGNVVSAPSASTESAVPNMASSISDETTQTIDTKDVSKALAGGGATTIPLSNEDTMHRMTAVGAKA